MNSLTFLGIFLTSTAVTSTQKPVCFAASAGRVERARPWRVGEQNAIGETVLATKEDHTESESGAIDRLEDHYKFIAAAKSSARRVLASEYPRFYDPRGRPIRNDSELWGSPRKSGVNLLEIERSALCGIEVAVHPQKCLARILFVRRRIEVMRKAAVKVPRYE
jgi:hypothetical protein